MYKITLRQARLINDLTLEDVSKISGFPPTTINRWEHNNPYPRVDKVMMLAKIYKIPFDDIIFFEEQVRLNRTIDKGE